MRIVPGVGRVDVGVGVAVAVLWAALAASASAKDPPRPDDDWTFRPTVLIRKGPAQGSGTVIASTDAETLVLTAAHVVEERGPLRVELHRYNLGLERSATRHTWPVSVAAEVAAADEAADVAVVRIRRLPPLPFVARLAAEGDEPAPGSVVTSIGIDGGTRLSSWPTYVTEVDRFEVEGTGAERLYVITARPPDHGRSGGGLFLPNGDLVGVCVGRVQVVRGRRSGIFASGASVRRLLRESALDDLVARPSPAPSPAATRLAPVTTTRARAPG